MALYSLAIENKFANLETDSDDEDRTHPRTTAKVDSANAGQLVPGAGGRGRDVARGRGAGRGGVGGRGGGGDRDHNNWNQFNQSDRNEKRVDGGHSEPRHADETRRDGLPRGRGGRGGGRGRGGGDPERNNDHSSWNQYNQSDRNERRDDGGYSAPRDGIDEIGREGMSRGRGGRGAGRGGFDRGRGRGEGGRGRGEGPRIDREQRNQRGHEALKKGGAGASNWGKVEETEGVTQSGWDNSLPGFKDDETPKAGGGETGGEVVGDNNTPKEGRADDERDSMMNLDQWHAEQRKMRANLPTAESHSTDDTDAALGEEKVREDYTTKQKRGAITMDFFAYAKQQGNDPFRRSARGRGGGRGDRGDRGDRGGRERETFVKREPAVIRPTVMEPVELDDKSHFPTLK